MWATPASLGPARQRHLLEAVLNALDAHVAIMDSEGTFVYLSDPWHEMQRAKESLISAPLGGNVRIDGLAGHAAVMPCLRDALAHVWQRHASHYSRQVRIDDDGRLRWIDLEVHRLQEGEVLVLLRDVTDITSREQDLHEQATTDSVTDLANRRLARDTLRAHIQSVKNGRSSLAVITCDLDDFKRVNDQLGHAAGDEVLRTVAKRWLAAIRPQDMLARVGGDEFLLLVPGAADITDIHTLAGRLQGALVEPIHTAGRHVPISASIGGVFFRAGTAIASADSALERADRALYRAKRTGTHQIHTVRANQPLG